MAVDQRGAQDGRPDTETEAESAAVQSLVTREEPGVGAGGVLAEDELECCQQSECDQWRSHV